MSGAKHTPGPLHVTREVNGDGEAQHTVRGALGSPLAVLSNYAPREQKANADLYAAAPELLDALREVFSLEDQLLADIYGREFVANARAAIAKAIGGAA